MSEKYEDEEYIQDPQVLRALIREATHHGIETRLYECINGKRNKFNIPSKLQNYLDIYKKRQLTMEKDDIVWVNIIISLLEDINNGHTPIYEGHTPTQYNIDEIAVVEKLLFRRRSIRQWKNKKVERSLIEKIIKAGIWASTGCNLQITRYLILDKKEDLEAIPSREFSGEATKIITVVDSRPYDILRNLPKKNMLFDAATAMQNMLLMSECLGLGAVWGTLNDKEIENIKAYFKLKDCYIPCAYISLGYPDEKVIPPGRISLEDAILY